MVPLWPYKHPSLIEGETYFHLNVTCLHPIHDKSTVYFFNSRYSDAYYVPIYTCDISNVNLLDTIWPGCAERLVNTMYNAAFIWFWESRVFTRSQLVNTTNWCAFMTIHQYS